LEYELVYEIDVLLDMIFHDIKLASAKGLTPKDEDEVILVLGTPPSRKLRSLKAAALRVPSEDRLVDELGGKTIDVRMLEFKPRKDFMNELMTVSNTSEE
jgi:hypothetical protein